MSALVAGRRRGKLRPGRRDVRWAAEAAGMWKSSVIADKLAVRCRVNGARLLIHAAHEAAHASFFLRPALGARRRVALTCARPRRTRS